MGFFIFLPLVLPLTAWPIARLAEQHLHPRAATRLLTTMAAVMALCSTVCLALLMVVGTAQLPGNPLPDGWSDPEVRAAVPYDEVAGKGAIPALFAVAGVCIRTAWRHFRLRRRAHRALAGLPSTEVAVLRDDTPYAYALPGARRDRIVVTTALLGSLDPGERRALFAHERAHLTARHHRYLLTVQLAARANPFLRPLSTAVSYTAERWADEDAAAVIGSRRTVARAIGKAALLSRGAPVPALAGFAAPGPIPRRVAALLGPAPSVRHWPSVFTGVGLAAWGAAAGTAVSAMSSANSAVTMFVILHAATPL
ncbi:M56 family metallopeptidase [Streptomyces acidiscabies]|uniref:M56 family metallopeptidase n=1 Tax=Streptomyces acidiscabies TaxID=42234 RepID=A0AAP6EGA6_9ACTN|nr:M56 family metallopeptidase [Streptomyces acidiscabies]MBP5938076.1 M56 family metallopeptidase [Streptomyces sp. LBUM 1476]MBZ3909085.1 M56 family metallopeptidase [Streptomyces acidiscabies]MDX2961624.1 M56 family metallopeptidase [Streptomyces acidiscabies]MDX3016508.1 M56 family metallopeptidase [Streptomyces acidiscabies]MDX3788587.1 M56 family metallopeptidase [Streptomyces acidiscabies]